MFLRFFLCFYLLMRVLFISSEAAAETPSSNPHCKDLEILKAEALHYDPKALFELALMYSKGVCVPENADRAAELLKASSDLGYTPALYLAADLLNRAGRDDKALPVALRAAQKGDADAQTLTAYLYMSGNGIVNDDDEAAKWAKRAAEQGSGVGQFMIGVCYLEGIGIKKDWIEADKWLLLAIRSKPIDEKTDKEVSERQKALEAHLSKNDVIEAHRRADLWKATPETHP